MSYPILRSSLSSQTCTGLRLIIASHTELRYLGIPLKYLCSVLFHLRGMELIFRCDLLDRADAFDRLQDRSCLQVGTVDSSSIFHASVWGFSPERTTLPYDPSGSASPHQPCACQSSFTHRAS
jgi:hypothetical protein